MLRAELLHMNATEPARWQDITTRLRPFVAHRVSPPDVDDVMQEIFIRMQRGIASLRDEDRFTSWLFQLARNTVADHMRTRARHPLPDGDAPDSPAPSPVDDREAMRSLSSCVAVFVAALSSPYREAITLVELEGLTAREAAEMAGISLSGMKSRVQRGREQLRYMFEECCDIALDARGKVTDFTPRGQICPRCG